MKIIHRGKIIAVVGFALGAAACGDITGINSNPYAPEDVSVGPLFTRSVQTGVNRWLGNAYNLRGLQFVAQHLAEVAYPADDQYANLRGSNTAGSFNGPFTAELVNLRIVIDKATAANQPGIVGPAQVLQAWSYGYLTDTWGDIPFSDALKGDAADAVLLPKYDAQKDVYDGLFQQLAGAVTTMDGTPAGNLGSADPIFGGNTVQWQKFANSLRARMAMRIVNVDPARADQELKAAFTAPGGVFTSVADNAQLKWPGDGVYDNPWWSGTFQSRDDHRVSKTLMDIMLASNDPRIPVYAQKTVSDTTINGAPCPAGGCYAGLPNALTHGGAGALNPFTSRAGAIFYAGQTPYGNYGAGPNAQTPSYLMTFAELSFIRAEAAERSLGGQVPANAKQYYEDGIKASMAQWKITDQAKIDAYLQNPAIAYQGGVAGLRQIATQKWLALYTDGLNVWAEWRRTCQPATVKAGPETIVAYVPRRLEYSTTEASSNKANLNAAIARQGPDNFATRMYWDTKPEVAPTFVDAATCAGQR